MSNEFLKQIEPEKAALRSVSDFIHENPELGYQEVRASEMIAHFFEERGFRPEHPWPEYPTAFRVSCGSGEPSLLFLAEMDALPGLGHACGHNLIAVAGMTAFLAAVRTAQKEGLPGKFTLIGTPAEEIYSGKTHLQKLGAFDGYDAAFIQHPYAYTSTDPGWLSVVKFTVRFHGVAAHAAASPEQGRNALDAAVLLYNSVAVWRQQLPEPCRVHGIIRKGGDSPNIIPDLSEMLWYLRAPTKKISQEMRIRFEQMVQSAAAMTGTIFELEPAASSDAEVFNAPLNQAWAENWQKFYGETVRVGNGTEGRASSDFGNVSVMMPGINGLFHITNGKNHALHTPEFREDAATDFAFENAVRAGTVSAASAIRFLKDPEFREAVRTDWKKRTE